MTLESIMFSLKSDLWIVAPALIPAVVGFALLLADRLLPGRLSTPWARFLALLALACAGWLELNNTFGTGNGNPFLHDPFARFMILTAILSCILLVTLFGHYRSSEGDQPQHNEAVRNSGRLNRFFAAVLFLVVGVVFLSTAYDLITLFVGLELCVFPIYLLLFQRLTDPEILAGAGAVSQRRATTQIFLFGLFSSLLLAFGLITIYGLSGATQLIQVRINLSVIFLTYKKIGPALIAAVALTGAGIAAKMGLAPFHLWLGRMRKSAEPAALVLALVSGAIIGVVAISRLFSNALVAFSDEVMAPLDWPPMFLTLLTLSAFLASIASFRENTLWRIAIWLALAHTSFLLIGPITLSAMGIGAMLFHALSYLIALTALFSLLENISHDSGELTLESIAGLGRRSPLVGGVLALVVASLGAAPFTAGLSARIFLAKVALSAGAWWMTAVLVTTTVVLLLVCVRVVVALYRKTDAPASGACQLTLPLSGRIAAAVVAATLVYLGVAPEALLEIANHAAEVFAL